MKPRYKSVFFLWILKLLIVEFLDDLKVTQMPFHRICGQLLLLLLLLLLFLVLFFFFFFRMSSLNDSDGDGWGRGLKS